MISTFKVRDAVFIKIKQLTKL